MTCRWTSAGTSPKPLAQYRGDIVGRPNQNYLARRFKAHYGLSVTTYRARFATSAIHLQPGDWSAGMVQDAG